eukprot:SAG11_NODE_1193_length_5551_cov_2.289252_4_plen_76_part_00
MIARTFDCLDGREAALDVIDLEVGGEAARGAACEDNVGGFVEGARSDEAVEHGVEVRSTSVVQPLRLARTFRKTA